MAEIHDNIPELTGVIAELPLGTVFKYDGEWYVRCMCYDNIVTSFNDTRAYPEPHCGVSLRTGKLEIPLSIAQNCCPQYIAISISVGDVLNGCY